MGHICGPSGSDQVVLFQHPHCVGLLHRVVIHDPLVLFRGGEDDVLPTSPEHVVVVEGLLQDRVLGTSGPVGHLVDALVPEAILVGDDEIHRVGDTISGDGTAPASQGGIRLTEGPDGHGLEIIVGMVALGPHQDDADDLDLVVGFHYGCSCRVVRRKKREEVRGWFNLRPDQLVVLLAVALLSVMAIQPCLGHCTALGTVNRQGAGAQVQGHPAVTDTAGSKAIVGVFRSLQRFLFDLVFGVYFSSAKL